MENNLSLALNAPSVTGFTSCVFLLNYRFLNARSQVRSLPGSPSRIKPQAKLIHKSENALNSCKFTKLHQISQMIVGKTGGESSPCAATPSQENNQIHSTDSIAGGLMDFIEVSIRKWGEYNPRKDFKQPRWFAMNNRILEDASIYDLSGDEFKAWVYILCQASQKNNGRVQIFFRHAENSCGIKKKTVLSAVSKLTTSKTIEVIEITKEVQATNVCVQKTNVTLHNTTEQDITEQDTTESLARSAAIGDDPLLNSFLLTVKTEIIEAWISAYNRDWVMSEVLKARVWCLANKTKAPKKNYGSFITNWLSRGWETYRKTLPSNQHDSSFEGSAQATEARVLAYRKARGIE